MTGECYLVLDIGTGSVRAALINASGAILARAAREQEQIVPQFGWSEQKPENWWQGACQTIRQVLAERPERPAVICICGQMHGLVLIDSSGHLVRETAPLWNDKRALGHVRAFEAAVPEKVWLDEAANPPTPAWPGFTLQWVRDNDPKGYARAAMVLMPKDYINFRLTGTAAMDTGDASLSFMIDANRMAWSPTLVALLGLDPRLLPPIRRPSEILGAVTAVAAAETGIPTGTPVLVGAADYPAALLGSGVCRPGLGSDSTGSGTIITMIADRPVRDSEVCNVATAEGNWGPFVLLETGGDGLRWARRTLHDSQMMHEDIVTLASSVQAGSDALFFLPFLTGERLGPHRNARAQFVGLGAGHGAGHMHRAIMEGIAFAMVRHVRAMESALGCRLERVFASGGGARNALWLKIKASAFGVPFVVPQEPECGLIGCAALAATATGRFSTPEIASDAMVRLSAEIFPDPRWAEVYARYQPVFERIYFHSRNLSEDLDQLAKTTHERNPL